MFTESPRSGVGHNRMFLGQVFFLMYLFKKIPWQPGWGCGVNVDPTMSSKDLWLKQRKSTEETVSTQNKPGLPDAKWCGSANPAWCSTFKFLSFNQFLNHNLGFSSNARISDANCKKFSLLAVHAKGCSSYWSNSTQFDEFQVPL